MVGRCSKIYPTVIDLFAGAGVFSSAFARAKFSIIQAVELDVVAAQTYSRNVGEITIGDVRRCVPRCTCDVLIAGPPCQGFSTLGKRDASDPRNGLGLEVVRWAKAAKPSIIVIENVAAFMGSPVWHSVVRRLKRLGYEVGSAVLNAADFGVPQIRLRSFTFASKVGLPMIRTKMNSTYGTVRDAFEGLSPVPDGHNNHYSPQPSELALARMKVIPEGGDKRDIMRNAPKMAAPSWWRNPGDLTDVWGRMAWDKPSNTLRTSLQNPSKGRYIHPDQHRVISLREAARLHTIPDSWTFVGYPTQIARQIGNSVPLQLGRAVAMACRRQLQ